jgi:hypothetical protein
MPANTQLVSLGGSAKRKQKAHFASSTGYSFAVRQTVQLDDCWKEKNRNSVATHLDTAVLTDYSHPHDRTLAFVGKERPTRTARPCCR